MLTVIEVPGTRVAPMPVSPASFTFSDLDPEIFDYQPVYYPANLYPMQPSITLGKAACISKINSAAGSFALIGISQGGAVIAEVYNELRYGSLQSRRSDFIAGFSLESPRRQDGYTFPGETYKGHHGIDRTNLLEDCEPDIWWEFCQPGDIIADCGDDEEGILLGIAADFIMTDYTGCGSLFKLLTNPQPVPLYQAIKRAIFGFFLHSVYYAPIPGDARLCPHIVRDRLYELAGETPP